MLHHECASPRPIRCDLWCAAGSQTAGGARDFAAEKLGVVEAIHAKLPMKPQLDKASRSQAARGGGVKGLGARLGRGLNVRGYDVRVIWVEFRRPERVDHRLAAGEILLCPPRLAQSWDFGFNWDSANRRVAKQSINLVELPILGKPKLTVSCESCYAYMTVGFKFEMVRRGHQARRHQARNAQSPPA